LSCRIHRLACAGGDSRSQRRITVHAAQ
jgi:hypothetical protein